MHGKTLVGSILVAVLAGSLLAGCSADVEETAASSAAEPDMSVSTTPQTSAPVAASPAVGPLVGGWAARSGPTYECEGGDSWHRTFLDITADGRWVLPFCDNGGSVEITSDTITYLGGDRCDAGARGLYTYTLTDDELIQEVSQDPCRPRRQAFDGVTFSRMPNPTGT